MELLAELTWVDLAVLLVLAVGVFVGFTQGMIRYVLNSIGVLVAFVLAAQLKGPIVDLLGFWTAFTPAGRELLLFVLLFFGFLIGGWFVVRALYRRTRLPIAKPLDELGGALFGLLFVALVLSFHLLVLDSFFMEGNRTSGWVGSYYDIINDSLIIDVLREVLIPTAGFLVRPFVPAGIAALIPR